MIEGSKKITMDRPDSTEQSQNDDADNSEDDYEKIDAAQVEG